VDDNKHSAVEYNDPLKPIKVWMIFLALQRKKEERRARQRELLQDPNMRARWYNRCKSSIEWRLRGYNEDIFSEAITRVFDGWQGAPEPQPPSEGKSALDDEAEREFRVIVQNIARDLAKSKDTNSISIDEVLSNEFGGHDISLQSLQPGPDERMRSKHLLKEVSNLVRSIAERSGHKNREGDHLVLQHFLREDDFNKAIQKIKDMGLSVSSPATLYRRRREMFAAYERLKEKIL
jgi:hypothetical protein